VASFKELTEKHGRKMAPFAIAWILNNQAITSIICGANSIGQLEENLGAVELKLTEEEITFCNKVWNELRPPMFFYGAQQLHR
jgi:aryl-alcohol dehydrogenase-like predicted oxidoreductase